MVTKNDLSSIAKILIGVVTAKFGPGAIGRIGSIAIAGSVIVGLVAIVFAIIDIRYAVALPFFIILIIGYAIHRSFKYAEDHPELAAMDGAQISRLLTQQAAMRQIEGIPNPPEYVEATTQNPLIELHREDQ